MSRLKCLFVDWHKTLSTSLFWEHLRDPSHSNHLFFEPITSLLFRNHDMYNRLLKPWMRGDLTSEDVITAVCQETELDYAAILSELIWSCQQLQFVSPEIPEYISNIRAKGIKVVIATDNMDSFVRWTVPSLQLRDLFDNILCSSTLKGLKADIDKNGRSVFFADYLDLHQIDQGESLLLDDDKEEEFIHTIQLFGIKYQHIEPGIGLVPALQMIIASLM